MDTACHIVQFIALAVSIRFRMAMQVCKVYIGSFNADKPIREDVNPYCRDLFEREQNDLLQDLFDIPQRSCDRKVSLKSLCSTCTQIHT